MLSNSIQPGIFTPRALYEGVSCESKHRFPQFLLSNIKQEFLTRESPVEARFPTSSGVAVKATGKELSLVFVRLPYLSNHGPNANGPFTTNLSKYMSHQTKNSVEGEDHVWVHQVWFAIFQDCTSSQYLSNSI